LAEIDENLIHIDLTPAERAMPKQLNNFEASRRLRARASRKDTAACAPGLDIC
jgi:hypothetical protein